MKPHTLLLRVAKALGALEAQTHYPHSVRARSRAVCVVVAAGVVAQGFGPYARPALAAAVAASPSAASFDTSSLAATPHGVGATAGTVAISGAWTAPSLPKAAYPIAASRTATTATRTGSIRRSSGPRSMPISTPSVRDATRMPSNCSRAASGVISGLRKTSARPSWPTV